MSIRRKQGSPSHSPALDLRRCFFPLLADTLVDFPSKLSPSISFWFFPKTQLMSYVCVWREQPVTALLAMPHGDGRDRRMRVRKGHG